MKRAKIIALAVVGWVGGCQTSGKEAVHYDKKEDAVYVYATRDSRSLMPKGSKVSSIKTEVDRLKGQLRKTPNDVDTMLSLAKLFVVRGDLGDAEVLARRTLSRDFDNRPAKIVLAQVAYMQGKNHVAGAILKRLGKSKNPESEVLNLLAMIELQDGEAARSFNLIRMAIKRNPDDIAARMNLGIFYLKFLKVDLAQAQFKEILKRMPENLDAKLHLGISYAAQGNVKQAKAIYAQLSSRGNPLIDFNSAVLRMRAKDYDGALDLLKNYVKKYANKSSSVIAAQELMNDIRLNRAAQSTLSDDDIEDLEDALAKGKVNGDTDDDFTGNPMTNAH